MSRLEIEKLEDFRFSVEEEVSTDSTSISSISSQLEVPQPESSGPEEWAELKRIKRNFNQKFIFFF